MSKMLIICEKPDQARKYADALKKEGAFKKSNGYLESEKYIFTYGFGHLVTSKGPRDYEEFSTSKNKGWNWSSIPFYPPNGTLDYIIAEKSKVQQMNIIGDLLKRSDVATVVNAADAGREGELIFWEIYDYFNSKKPVKRLWCSTYVAADVRKAFGDLRDEPFFMPKRDAAYARQLADWILGMNLTVGFTIKASMGRTLHVGRVQTPTIALLVQRKQEIDNFKAETYYEVETEFGNKYKGKWFKEQFGNTKISVKDEAEAIVAKIQNKIGTVTKKDVNKETENPKKLFSLTDLQQECDRKYGYDPDKTLNIAQVLYEKYAILSYPRTSSSFLAEAQVEEIPEYLEAVAIPPYKNFVENITTRGIKTNSTFVNDKEVTDHHAIIPTKKKANLDNISDEKDQKGKLVAKREEILNVYDLVVKRFLAVFYPPALYEKTEIVTEVEQETFKTSGKILVDLGWKAIYGSSNEDDEDDDEEDAPKNNKKQEEKVKIAMLPPIDMGEQNEVSKVEAPKKETKAPSHHTNRSLLGIMKDPRRLLTDDELKLAMKEAKAGLGTPATRAQIIKNVIDRGYVVKKGKSLVATDLAEKLISVAPDDLKSPIVTAEWEQKLADVEEGKLASDEFELGIKQYVEQNLHLLQHKELEVNFGNVNDGKSIGTTCPKCGKDVVEKKGYYACQTHTRENPCFRVYKKISEKNITESQVKQLATKGETGEIKGFLKRDKSGKFNAKLKWNPEKLKVDFAFVEAPKLMCPFCNKGQIRENSKAFGCSNWQEGCKFTVWKNTNGKTITMAIVKELVQKKQTKKLSGFKKADGEEYEARLVLNLEKKQIDRSYK